MLRRMVGLVCLMARLAAIVASSVCGSPASSVGGSCGAPKPNGAQSSPAAAAQVPRRNRKRGARPTQKPSAPPEYNLAKVLDGVKENEHFKDSELANPSESTLPKPHAGSAEGKTLPNAQATGGKNIDPAFRHHRLVILAWATGVWEGTPDLDTMQAALRGSLARLGRLKRPLRRYGRSGFFRAYASAPGLECAVSEAPHDPRRHQDRPPGRCAQDGGRLGGPGIPSVVRQLCTLESVQGPAVLGSHQATLRLWQTGRLVTLASERARQAGLTRHLDTGKSGAAQERGRRQLPIVQRWTRRHVPPLLRMPGLADRKRFVRLTGGAARFSGTIGPQMGSWRDTFSRTAPRAATARCGAQAGQWWRSTMWETSKQQLTGRCRATFCAGQSARDGEDYAAAMAGQFTLDPLTLNIDCEGTIATINGPKHKALGARGPRAHVWNRLLFSHDEVRAVKVKGHATERDVEAGRTSHLCKRETTLQTPSPKKGLTHTSQLFESPRQSLPVLPWPSKRHVGRPKRTFCSGSGDGTTPGLLRHDHGYGPRERDSSERRRRRLLRQLQVRFLTGFLPCFPHVSCKTVTSTLARSEGTACNWDEFSMREAEHWTTPSSSAPSVELSTGSVRTLFAANAANSQVAERHSYAN